jgi:hypothetical protein
LERHRRLEELFVDVPPGDLQGIETLNTLYPYRQYLGSDITPLNAEYFLLQFPATNLSIVSA